MDDITHAIQVEPGRWRVYVARENMRQVRIMTALQFSRLLAGEPHEVELTFMEWEDEGADDLIEGRLLLKD
ncbi:hypothetical protein [Rhizobium rhizophilum]|uniref:Uncharacterized protein n=1 Tax=Rhizobium rhizophilum TaxID=1850373 RepID=A0ABY2QT20_9HYPH|nr:hypothetical protein [Rhizobium rhizophilum]THV13737.1 hypothetical protein E9677_12570 [Rhizobium rhizophilum]